MIAALATYPHAAFAFLGMIVAGTAAVLVICAFIVVLANVILCALSGAGESGSGEEEAES